jgi:hypothetical protein
LLSGFFDCSTQSYLVRSNTFFHNKDWHGLRRFRLRLLRRVKIEAQLIASGQKISSGCSKNEDGDGVRAQQKPFFSSFWLLLGG